MADFYPDDSIPPAREAEVTPAQRVSSVWIIPLLAMALGGWLIFKHFNAVGPEITISFDTAEGLEANKTPVLCRSVEVGKVSSIRLAEDLENVLVQVKMEKGSEELLQGHPQFWVVRPRVGVGGISGLGTIVSGSYIQLDPGSEPEGVDAEEEESTVFIGLEEPPVTSQAVPGLRITLEAKEADSLGPGAPISYHGYRVGQIEKADFDPDRRVMVYQAFVRSPYENLVTENVAFWDASGFRFEAGAKGVELRTGSIESIVSGGVAFAVPPEMEQGEPVKDGRLFKIYEDLEDVKTVELNERLPFLLQFDDSVRGLTEGASVEFRGIQVGRVSDISFEHRGSPSDVRVPVLVRLDPVQLRAIAPLEAANPVAGIEKAVEIGLRATLSTGSLITGQLFVELVIDEDAPIERMRLVGGLPTIPTQAGTFARLEEQVGDILKKVEKLPIESLLLTAEETLVEFQTTAKAATQLTEDLKGSSVALEALLTSDEVTGIPTDVRTTLTELQRTLAGAGPDSVLFSDLGRTLEEFQTTLRSIKSLTDTVDNKPNSLIFGKEGGRDPVPGLRRRR